MAIVDKNTQITGELTQDEITPVEEFAGPQTHTQVYLPPQQKRHNRRSIIGLYSSHFPPRRLMHLPT